jgi:hypothetical protein
MSATHTAPSTSTIFGGGWSDASALVAIERALAFMDEHRVADTGSVAYGALRGYMDPRGTALSALSCLSSWGFVTSEKNTRSLYYTWTRTERPSSELATAAAESTARILAARARA